MAQKPIAMEQIKQILQLSRDGVTIREISRRVGISRNSVRKYLKAFPNNNDQASDEDIVNSIFSTEQTLAITKQKTLYDHFDYAKGELPKTGVTRQLLWNEYIDEHPEGYGYSQYCYLLNQYLGRKDVSMHLEYTAADMIMIDFAGKKQYYIDLETGERIDCQVFIAILPFSGLIYCKAVHTQQTHDFASCINDMLSFYKGVPSTILCDNLKTAVTKASKYEPVFTELCYQLAEHYQTTFSATRPYSPRDKAMVERAVNIVYNHIYGPLRNRDFTSIEDLNCAMLQQLELLNNNPYRGTAHSRYDYYHQQEATALKELPGAAFVTKKVATLTVQRNYHIQLREDCLYYSVPYLYAGKKVQVLYDNRTVEVYFDNNRIAVHIRKVHSKAYTTLAEHMPPHHQRMQQIKGWNKEDLLSQASRIGPSVKEAAARMMENSIYIEQNYKACFGMLMLKNKYGEQRLEAACGRVLQASKVNYTMIKNILERSLDKQLPLTTNYQIPLHDNIRGSDHYQ